jgi:hypothetical protein
MSLNSPIQECSIPSKYDFKPYAYGFQKDSPYLGLFNHYLKEMKERGTLKKILNKYESQPQICPDSSGLPLGFDNCFTAFMAWIVRVVIGLVLLLIELCSRRTKGLNLKCMKIYEMYEGRDRETEGENGLPQKSHEIDKDAMIYSLKLQVKVLKNKLKHSYNRSFDYT